MRKFFFLLLLFSILGLTSCTYPPKTTTDALTIKEFLATRASFSDGEEIKLAGIVGYKYACPPCPKGYSCKPCFPNHILLYDRFPQDRFLEQSVGIEFSEKDFSVYQQVQEGYYFLLTALYTTNMSFGGSMANEEGYFLLYRSLEKPVLGR